MILYYYNDIIPLKMFIGYIQQYKLDFNLARFSCGTFDVQRGFKPQFKYFYWRSFFGTLSIES